MKIFFQCILNNLICPIFKHIINIFETRKLILAEFYRYALYAEYKNEAQELIFVYNMKKE